MNFVVFIFRGNLYQTITTGLGMNPAYQFRFTQKYFFKDEYLMDRYHLSRSKLLTI